MIAELWFGDQLGSPQGVGGTSTDAWEATARTKRAVDRNIDGGVLALMFAGIVLAVGSATASLRETLSAQREVGQAEPRVLVAVARCVLDAGAAPLMIVE